MTHWNIGAFGRAVTLVVSGTALAQAVAVLTLPVLTRLYTPEQFGALAVYASMVSILISVACLRLEIAIPLPEHDAEAANILSLSLISVVFVSVISGLLCWGINEYTQADFGLVGITQYAWLIPIGVFAGGVYNSLMYWSTRKGAFSAISRSKIFQSVSAAVVQIATGLISGATWGLLIGYVATVGGGAVGLAQTALKDAKSSAAQRDLRQLWVTLKKYRKFPQFSTLEALSITAGLQLPLVIIAASGQGTEAGLLLVAMKAMQAPMALIGSAMSQAYLHQAPAHHRAGQLPNLTQAVVRSSLRVGVGPLVFVVVLAPELFGLVFGRGFRAAGDIAVWMLPWCALQLVASPIGMVMHVANRQKAMLVLTMGGLLIRVGAVMVAVSIGSSLVVEIYALSNGLFYLICLIVFTSVAGLQARDVRALIVDATGPIVMWLVGAALIRFALW